MMFSESRNDRRRRIGDRLRDRDNAAGIGDNSTEIGYDAAGIVDITANVIPCVAYATYGHSTRHTLEQQQPLSSLQKTFTH